MKNKFLNYLIDVFKYEPRTNYNFTLSSNDTQNNSNTIEPMENLQENVYPSVNVNLEYIKIKYNALINSDIKIREFNLFAKGNNYKAFILYIDGMCDPQNINRFILHPLMLKSKMNKAQDNIIDRQRKLNFNLLDYIYSSLIPENDVKKFKNFEEIINSVNMGNCALFIDTLDACLVIDAKGFEKRSINNPRNEIVIKGSQEAFVETIRTNTSILRRLVNNENLVIEDTSIGAISKTKCAICYIKGIANSDLIAEVKYRINNLDIDYIISSGQLEFLVKENAKSTLPEVISTERPDTAASSLLDGRVVVIVNGTPIVLIMPCTFFDLLASPEDNNINFKFANFLRIIRLIGCLIAILLPGLYIAITNFHEELIPTELLFSIISARQSVPISIEMEIILMEIVFELIHEAGIRVPSPVGSTMGIVGALVLGEAAVSASIVSPISIIIVAITGLSSFAIPNYSLEFHFRIMRFVFIFLGAILGFLGISFGLFVYIAILVNIKSFGIPYLSPYVPLNKINNNGYILSPLWTREKRDDSLNTKRRNKQANISMVWKKGGKS